MKKSGQLQFLSALTLIASLIIFSFGNYTESTINAINLPNPIIKDIWAPILSNLRNPIFIAIFYFLVLYGIVCRSLPSISPIIYTLSIIQYLIALKSIAYVGEINTHLLRGSIGILVIGYFFAIIAHNLRFVELHRIAFCSLVLTLIIVIMSINLSNIFSVPRYQFQFANPNFAGTGLVSILCFYCIFHNPSSVFKKLFLLILFFIFFVLVIMTGSRAAISGLCLLLLLRLSKNFSMVKIVVSLIVIISGILYLMFLTDIWAGRDTRLDLWIGAFSSPSYSILSGGNINDHKASVEGFFVTLPYTLGLVGFILLLIFLVQIIGILRQLYFAMNTQKEAIGILNFFIILIWMSMFESIFFGVLTPPMIIFVFLLSWYRCSHKPL